MPSGALGAVLSISKDFPKERSSAEVTIVTGVVPALTGRPVRSGLAMTGDLTIKGKELASRCGWPTTRALRKCYFQPIT